MRYKARRYGNKKWLGEKIYAVWDSQRKQYARQLTGGMIIGVVDSTDLPFIKRQVERFESGEIINEAKVSV